MYSSIQVKYVNSMVDVQREHLIFQRIERRMFQGWEERGGIRIEP